MREDPETEPTSPRGSVYDWYVRGMKLLDTGHPAAAATLLAHAVQEEPGTRSILEALGRAQFDAGQYAAAADSFRQIIEQNPADDYARFALGLSCTRTGRVDEAVEHLALATAMRPEASHYRRALSRARATRATRTGRR